MSYIPTLVIDFDQLKEKTVELLTIYYAKKTSEYEAWAVNLLIDDITPNVEFGYDESVSYKNEKLLIIPSGAFDVTVQSKTMIDILDKLEVYYVTK